MPLWVREVDIDEEAMDPERELEGPLGQGLVVHSVDGVDAARGPVGIPLDAVVDAGDGMVGEVMGAVREGAAPQLLGDSRRSEGALAKAPPRPPPRGAKAPRAGAL